MAEQNTNAKNETAAASAGERRPIILGIDLGTTNSLVAVSGDSGDAQNADAMAPRVLEGEGEMSGPMLPSVVRYGVRGEPGAYEAIVEAVGKPARDAAVLHPTRTVASVKRLMGRSATDAERDAPYLSYRVVAGPNETARAFIPSEGDEREGVVVSPQEVSAEILRALKARAEAALDLDVREAVVTVPAYFDDAQRQATRDAGRLAGLDVRRIVNEPTAAALAYGIGLRNREPETIAVFDLGGGTFDVSILQVIPAGHDADASDDGDTAFFQVLSTAGDTHLGGDDVDRMIVQLVLDDVAKKLQQTVEFPAGTRQALRDLAETTKIRLSTDELVTIELDLGGEAGVYRRSLTREELEEMMTPWVERAIARCGEALRDAKLTPAQIDRVVMVGGSTRIPLVRRRVGEFFGAEPYTALDPDLVVALGAAEQAAIIAGTNRSALLMDVIPLSLGIETMGGAVAKLIVRNSTVPARATEMFSTSVDGQTSIKINVLQGEREMVEHCRSLGEFTLSGIPPMPAGIPQLEVEFLVDQNGVLSVSAVEKRSGKRAAIQVVPHHGLSREEVDRIERDSFEHAREDMTRHRVVDLVVNAKLDLKWIGERLDAVGDELETDYRRDLEERIERLRGFVRAAEDDWRSVDPNEFHAAKEELDRGSMRLHEVSIARSLRESE